MKELYILGSLNMDLACYASSFPNKGETVSGHSFRQGAGGKGLNQAVAAARLGAKVHLLGAVGNDSFGVTMKGILAKEGIDISMLKTVSNVSTGVALIEVAEDTNRIMLDLGANLMINHADLDSFLAKAKQGDIFLCQGENNIDAIGYGLKLAKSKGMLTTLNPAPASTKMLPFLQYVDLLTPNETEAASLGGTSSYKTSINKLPVSYLAVTLGAEGYLLVENGKVVKEEKPPKVNVVDTTGAGDAFSGALAYFLLEGKTIEESLSLAMNYASLKTTKKGTSSAMPSGEEFVSFLSMSRDKA